MCILIYTITLAFKNDSAYYYFHILFQSVKITECKSLFTITKSAELSCATRGGIGLTYNKCNHHEISRLVDCPFVSKHNGGLIILLLLSRNTSLIRTDFVIVIFV